MDQCINLCLSRNEVERLLQIVQFYGESCCSISDRIFCYKVLRAIGFGNLRDELDYSSALCRDNDVVKLDYIVVLQSELDRSSLDYIGQIRFAHDLDEAHKIGLEFVQELSEYPAVANYSVYKLIDFC